MAAIVMDITLLCILSLCFSIKKILDQDLAQIVKETSIPLFLYELITFRSESSKYCQGDIPVIEFHPFVF